MSGTSYKALGFVVWKGAVWYVRRRYGTLAARGAAGGLLLGAAVAGVVVAAARRRGGDGMS